MKSHLTLGRIFGVQVGLHVSWIVIAVLIALSLAERFRLLHQEWSALVVWTSALVTAALFFGGILIHELAHARAARGFGLRVSSITLFALGGVSNVEQEARSARSEFWIAFVGPLTSALAGLLCFGAAAAAGWVLWSEPETPVHAVLVWLGYINVALAAFNLIPGYPLDGGRILKSLVWAATGSVDTAARSAARIGVVVGVVFIGVGLWSFFAAGAPGGLWLGLIGWFLMSAASASLMQATITRTLQGVRVADVMSDECARIEAGESLQAFVDGRVLPRGASCAVVQRGEQAVGLVTPSEIEKIDRERWASTSVQAVMRSLDKLKAVTPETPVMEALKQMARDRMGLLPVMSGGRLAGIVSRASILRMIEVRRQLSH